jgi:hypothetical protein
MCEFNTEGRPLVDVFPSMALVALYSVNWFLVSMTVLATELMETTQKVIRTILHRIPISVRY